ncbi:DUF3826 domain-containing protein [Spirosoma sp. KCTC 42546]|uniref:DUF3826 domain-containing protein n=1 Tax=Spirosoma sp. KCTC 42546 TaxID=2520506 RepID=UPI001158D839|nr:DUF3826 domain-containing protein [Spirosoma sp. KCTC 42546]QDK80638.1 DUF3826 domain-containing protein [Spirosoma sp. KCTC 42546]
MIYRLKNLLVSSLLTLLVALTALGQDQTIESKEAAYTRVINERAARIVATLGLTDPQVAERVKTEIAQQYRSLNTIHESRKEALAGITEQTRKEAIEADASQKLTALHREYLAVLSHDLTAQQVDMVKDGMTYGVLPITYKGYQAMLPDLTDTQKAQILAYLTEARERAMDEGTSEKKHAQFGKYKGRINNYLSAAGIDMKKASKEWEERIAREKEAGKSKE